MNKIKLQDTEIQKCQEFADKVVQHTYDRFKQSIGERSKRIFVGKVGELAFLKFLNSKGIFPETKEMFEIYEGQENVDTMDFSTLDGKKIDVKTAYESFHSRLLVPYDQFEGDPKDFYVGVKLYLSTGTVEIYGFCTKSDLEQQGKKDFGEGPAYWEFLNKLKDIEGLLLMMGLKSEQSTIEHFSNT